ncbi:AraC family transcriptional regulator [Roseburia hominis]
MEYVNFLTPPYPHFIVAGMALYRPGDSHGKRENIGVFDLIFIEYGELYITDGTQSYHLKQNDLLILKPDSAHFGHKIVSEKTKFYWLHFRTDGTYYYSPEFRLEKKPQKPGSYYTDKPATLALPLYKKLTPLASSEFLSIFSKLVSANIDKYQQTEIRGQAIPTPLECQILFLRLLGFVQVFQPQQNSSELLAANIMEYISQNYHTQITLESIADYFSFHPVHIIRCLKKEFGLTPNKVIMQVRIENSKKLLITSDLNISKISELVGFSTPSYFNKVFREHTGISPKAFREAKEPEAT